MKELSNGQLYYEIEFLVYEAGRIGRGHAQEVEDALHKRRAQVKERGFDNIADLRSCISHSNENYISYSKSRCTLSETNLPIV